MRRIISALLLLALLLSGCGGVSKEEYDAVVQERDALLAEAELQELQAQEASPNTVTVKVTGEFTATVRALIPDYVTDDETPRMAVVTLFQSTPFTLFGVDADRLEVGETYVFEVEMDRCQDITREEYESGSLLTPEIILPMYHPYIRISGFRLAEEKDCGLDSVHLEYELYES
ncbi:hypothetical protein [uncultured Oscillibacter sp.]|uniref:hypothetical protein n=1 Tax=uncultured Oscillibacter sp. TaxID=876091 RepID=UPI0026046438|nr:hypothetical protein [uncultured Oscillibacter sp.]